MEYLFIILSIAFDQYSISFTGLSSQFTSLLKADGHLTQLPLRLVSTCTLGLEEVFWGMRKREGNEHPWTSLFPAVGVKASFLHVLQTSRVVLYRQGSLSGQFVTTQVMPVGLTSVVHQLSGKHRLNLGENKKVIKLDFLRLFKSQNCCKRKVGL